MPCVLASASRRGHLLDWRFSTNLVAPFAVLHNLECARFNMDAVNASEKNASLSLASTPDAPVAARIKLSEVDVSLIDSD